MATGPAESRGFRRFFARIRNFLTRKQAARVERAAREELPASSKAPAQPSRPAVAPAPPPSAPRRAADGAPSAPSRDEIIQRERRVEELKRIEAQARKEREEIESKTAAQQAPVYPFEDFERKKGFNYSTWFKAFGTFGDLRDMGDSPQLLGDMEELEDFDVPSAFYSSTLLGKVKWKGIVSRETVIAELNSVAPWKGSDFREVYPRWEYRYFVAELVGDVMVGMYEWKARQPLDKRSRQRGYKPY